MSLRSEVIRIFNELVGAGKKITELPAATTPLAGTELLEIVQDGGNKRITAASLSSGGTGVQSVVAGTNITVDDTDPQNPIVSATGGGVVASVTGDGVDNSDPENPVISYPTPGDIGAATTGSVATVATNLSDHISDATAAHAASAISNTPSGSISSTDVQAAINELASDIAGITTADASESVKGIVELATQAETSTGTDDVRAVTPLKAFNQYDHKFDTINTQTGDYVLALTDKDTKTVVMNVASVSNTVTVPLNATVAFPVGTKIAVVQLGTGLTSIVATGGVTVHPSKGDFLGQGQYSAMILEKIGTDEWVLLNGPGPISGAAFTRTNDTNVTAVLSGSPNTALLAGVDIQLGWTGTLAVTRGGTGLPAVANGDVIIGSNTNVISVVNALATTRTAYWHLKAGTATASTSPLKFTSGTNLTTPENGAVEYDGTNYFVTSGAARHTLVKVLANSAVIDFGSVSAQSQVTNTITVTGAADGDEVMLGYTNAAANSGLIFDARVSATNTVTVTAYNITASPIDPASATFKVSVIKR